VFRLDRRHARRPWPRGGPIHLAQRCVATGGKLATATTAVWNGATYRQLRRLIRTTRPDVAHFENTFPLVSPAAYYACHAEDVPVLQMLHNFRIVRPSAILYRDGQVCEDCLGKRFAWPGIRHAPRPPLFPKLDPRPG
jgi:hypothetical protein